MALSIRLEPGAGAGRSKFAGKWPSAVPSKIEIASATPNARARLFGSIIEMMGTFGFIGVVFSGFARGPDRAERKPRVFTISAVWKKKTVKTNERDF